MSARLPIYRKGQAILLLHAGVCARTKNGRAIFCDKPMTLYIFEILSVSTLRIKYLFLTYCTLVGMQLDLPDRVKNGIFRKINAEKSLDEFPCPVAVLGANRTRLDAFTVVFYHSS